MKVLVGCEESQAVTIELRKMRIEAFSCDLKPCSGGHPEWHLQMDIFDAIYGKRRDSSGWVGELKTQNGERIYLSTWDMAIFFPDCTYLTCSAEWAYSDGPYHQKVKSGTLVGAARREARLKAVDFVKRLWYCGIPLIAIENPVGALSSLFRKPSQFIQPYQFGSDASKKTCLWLKGLPLLLPTEHIAPRIVNGKERWGNQTDSGQNKLSPSDNRAELRSKTFPGIAKSMASTWGLFLLMRNYNN